MEDKKSEEERDRQMDNEILEEGALSGFKIPVSGNGFHRDGMRTKSNIGMIYIKNQQ